MSHVIRCLDEPSACIHTVYTTFRCSFRALALFHGAQVSTNVELHVTPATMTCVTKWSVRDMSAMHVTHFYGYDQCTTEHALY